MRYARFEKDGSVACGIVEGDSIKLIAGEILDGGAPTGETVALDSVKLLPPVIPETFYAAGLNYVAHIMEQAESRGAKPNIPEKPDIGYRANNALIGNAEEIAQQMADRFHPDDRLMLWFDFFNHDSDRVVRNMRDFMEKVAPRVPHD